MLFGGCTKLFPVDFNINTVIGCKGTGARVAKYVYGSMDELEQHLQLIASAQSTVSWLMRQLQEEYSALIQVAHIQVQINVSACIGLAKPLRLQALDFSEDVLLQQRPVLDTSESISRVGKMMAHFLNNAYTVKNAPEELSETLTKEQEMISKKLDFLCPLREYTPSR